MLFFCRVFTVKINLIVKTQVCKSCFDNLRGLRDPTSKKTEGDLHGRVFRGFFRGTIFYGVFFFDFSRIISVSTKPRVYGGLFCVSITPSFFFLRFCVNKGSSPQVALVFLQRVSIHPWYFSELYCGAPAHSVFFNVLPRTSLKKNEVLYRHTSFFTGLCDQRLVNLRSWFKINEKKRGIHVSTGVERCICMKKINERMKYGFRFP